MNNQGLQTKYSERFQTLKQELTRLREHLLPQVFDPTGSYDDNVFTKALAYRVMAHAEFEAYVEDRVRELYVSAMLIWEQHGRMSKVVACMLAFSSIEIEEIPATKSPTQTSQKSKWDKKIKLS